MSENKIGFALVHEICPICGKPMNEQILMNSVLSKKYAKEIENVHGKAIGYSKTWEKNDKCITWNGGLFEHKDNVLTGRYFGICNIWNYETDKGYMPKPKRIIPCVEVEISPDNWIMAVSADSTKLLLLSIDYNIKWEQVSCLKGIRLEDVTPELDSKAYAELKNNKH